jgi:predicted NAD-dependent protein-ADP-ribosyltransferase YbiA (DUF1768 family)
MCTKVIDSFEGQYEFLSNFWQSNVILDEISYRTVEAAYQAAKTLDPKQREYIRDAKFASIAKKRGRAVEIRPDWEDVKIEIMLDLLRQKLLTTTHYDYFY